VIANNGVGDGSGVPLPGDHEVPVLLHAAAKPANAISSPIWKGAESRTYVSHGGHAFDARALGMVRGADGRD
jgi:hypothetical protein